MRFVVLAWGLSRLLVIAVLLSHGHSSAFTNWDGAWYGSIVVHGYEYSPDGRQHNVAFFPLFPLLAWPFVSHGFPWALVAAVLANVAFLAAIAVLHRIAARQYDQAVANWSVALACLLPASLFCSVAYPQSLFLLCSAGVLYLWDRSKVAAGGAGAFASAASPLGIPLAAAMVVDGIVQRRAAAVFAGIIALFGAGAFAWYCAVHFGDAFAFVHAQRGWRASGFGFDAHAWRAIFASLLTLDGVRQNGMVVLLVPLGLVAVLLQARNLGRLMAMYALLALGLLIFSGTPFSVDRNAYAVAPLLIAYGAILRRVPAAGYIVLVLCALLLVIDAGRFARFEWVA